jgi:hypothetical protein
LNHPELHQYLSPPQNPKSCCQAKPWKSKKNKCRSSIFPTALCYWTWSTAWHWDRKMRKALSLGNNEHSKCRILFKDEEGLKFVETTVWSYDGEHIVLKAGVTVPFQRVIDVQVL